MEDTHKIEIRNMSANVTVRWHDEDASFDHAFGTQTVIEPVFDEAWIEDFKQVDGNGEVVRTLISVDEIEEFEVAAFEKCYNS